MKSTIEAAVVRVVRVERQSEQTLLQEVVLHQFGQVEERLGQQVAVLVDDADPAHPLDDEEPAAAIPGAATLTGSASPPATLTSWIEVAGQRAAWLSRWGYREVDDRGRFLGPNAKRRAKHPSCRSPGRRARRITPECGTSQFSFPGTLSEDDDRSVLEQGIDGRG